MKLNSLSALALCYGLAFPAMTQQNTDWIFCVITDDYNDSAYVTAIFHGNYDLMDDYQQHFTDWVFEQYGDEHNDDVACTFEEHKDLTEQEREVQLADNQEFYASVITVDWLPQL